MNFQILLALLTRLTDLDRTEAEELADLLSRSVQPSTFKEAERVVNDVVKEAKKKK